MDILLPPVSIEEVPKLIYEYLYYAMIEFAHFEIHVSELSWIFKDITFILPLEQIFSKRSRVPKCVYK